jgi:hypothetical protein
MTGISLRDYFAGLAMTVMIGRHKDFDTARRSYELADEMIARRNSDMAPQSVTDLRPESERNSHVYVPRVQS